MKLPSYPSRHVPISADWGRSVVNYLKALTGRTSGTVRVSMTTGGTTYEVRKTPSSSSELKPFQLVNASTDEEALVRIVYSSLAGEPPEGMSPGDDPIYTLPVTGSSGVYGQITIDVPGDGSIMFRDIITADEKPDDNHEAGVYHVLIGSVSIENNKIKSISNARYGPIEVQVCRNIYAEDGDVKYLVSFL